MMVLLKEMLLIEDSSVLKLYKEMLSISKYFVAPVFLIALTMEYFNEMNFGYLLKKLLFVTVFIGAFYQFHTSAIDISLRSSSEVLTKVSPRNLFVKKWNQTKVKTEFISLSKEKKTWSFLESWAIPNLNDFIATSFFILSKIFIWLLKLIYSTVYHLTYVFSGVTAVLYFLGWTKDALKGTVQASLWCILMPFVIVAILALVGNSIDETALKGDLIIAKMDTIVWLFGVTLLLLISPMITFGMIKGDGIHSFSSKMSSQIVGAGLKSMALLPMMLKVKDRVTSKDKFQTGKDKLDGFSKNSNSSKFGQSNASKSNEKSKEKDRFREQKQNSNQIDRKFASKAERNSQSQRDVRNGRTRLMDYRMNLPISQKQKESFRNTKEINTNKDKSKIENKTNRAIQTNKTISRDRSKTVGGTNGFQRIPKQTNKRK